MKAGGERGVEGNTGIFVNQDMIYSKGAKRGCS